MNPRQADSPESLVEWSSAAVHVLSSVTLESSLDELPDGLTLGREIYIIGFFYDLLTRKDITHK